MNYCEIKEYDIANGPGIRLCLFVSGCSHHCKNCFQPQTWDPNYGEEFTSEVMENILELLSDDSYQGITLLGGEPLEPYNQAGLLPLIREFKRRYPGKDVWCFTGYLYDEDVLGKMLDNIPETRELLSLIDVLVDGEFKEELKDITLLFKGSSNQRTIDVKRSLNEGKVIEWDPQGISMSGCSHL